MEIPRIHESEYRLCQLVWEREPIKSTELARLCLEQLGWKSSTTYTVLKRLSQRGVLKNENTMVTALISQAQMQEAESGEVVEKRFAGSLPAFVAAFTRQQKLTDGDIEQLQAMIDRYREEHAHD